MHVPRLAAARLLARLHSSAIVPSPPALCTSTRVPKQAQQCTFLSPGTLEQKACVVPKSPPLPPPLLPPHRRASPTMLDA